MHSINIHAHAKRKKGDADVLQSSRLARFTDVIVYPIGITSLLMALPQMYEIWIVGNVSGVSFISWFAWFLISGFWIVYGAAHKVRAVMLLNCGSFVLYGLIALGIYLHT